jgi:hypothetical protein
MKPSHRSLLPSPARSRGGRARLPLLATPQIVAIVCFIPKAARLLLSVLSYSCCGEFMAPILLATSCGMVLKKLAW